MTVVDDGGGNVFFCVADFCRYVLLCMRFFCISCLAGYLVSVCIHCVCSVYCCCCCFCIGLSDRTMNSDRKVISIDWSQWMSFDFSIFFFSTCPTSTTVLFSFSYFIFSLPSLAKALETKLPHKCLNETNKKSKDFSLTAAPADALKRVNQKTTTTTTTGEAAKPNRATEKQKRSQIIRNINTSR